MLNVGLWMPMKPRFALLTLMSLTGCVAAGVTSGGHFFIFPGIGVLVLIFIVLLVLRRR